jgi:L-threonylcarbamoyladenylate synthase
VTSGLKTMAVRVPKHPMTSLLLSKLDYPLAAPSANPFGYISPTSALHVEEQLGSRIPYVLDGGDCSVGVESTIISFAKPNAPCLLRYGGISKEAIEALIGKLEINLNSGSSPEAPGQLTKHYSPKTPFVLTDDLDTQLKISSVNRKNVGVLRFKKDLQHPTHNFLSENGSLTEAACNLFSLLRDMDKSNFEVIIAEMVPNQGIGLAINDRLRRAAN